MANSTQVIGQFDLKDRNAPLDLTSTFVKNNKGELIQLDNVVTVVEQSNPPQLFHNNRYMSATVSAGLAPGKSMGDGIDAMNAISKKVLDETFTTDLAGESRDFVESSSNTMFAFGLALLLIYLILAAQFESFIDPMIIILTVPMAVAGALFSLWLFGQSWNIFSQIGTIMLIGLGYQKRHFDCRICQPIARTRQTQDGSHYGSFRITFASYFNDEFGDCLRCITHSLVFGSCFYQSYWHGRCYCRRNTIFFDVDLIGYSCGICPMVQTEKK
jgi:hypothetical protein